MKSGKDDHTQKLHDALKKEIEELHLLSGNIASLDEDALKLIKAASLTVGDGDGYVNQLDKILDNDRFRAGNFTPILNAKDLGTLLVNNRYLEEGSEIKTEYDEYVEQVKKVNSTLPNAITPNNQLPPIANVKQEQDSLTDQGERRQELDKGTERPTTENKKYNPEKEAAAATKIQRVFKNYSKQRDSEKTRLGKLLTGLLETNLSYIDERKKKEEELKEALYKKAGEIVELILDEKDRLKTLEEQLNEVKSIETTKKPTVEDIKIPQPQSQSEAVKPTKLGKSLFTGKVSQPSKTFAKEEKKKKEDRKDPSQREGQKR